VGRFFAVSRAVQTAPKISSTLKCYLYPSIFGVQRKWRYGNTYLLNNQWTTKIFFSIKYTAWKL